MVQANLSILHVCEPSKIVLNSQIPKPQVILPEIRDDFGIWDFKTILSEDRKV
jgi:hypothetical protein